jgi:AcrR family transcriptional regulator
MMTSGEATDRSRKTAILVAAEAVFLKFGYRKTSMDDVAKAADVSRQGLYLHFANKEDLFREMVREGLDRRLREVRLALSDQTRPIGHRLAAALNEWFGDREKLGNNADLLQASLQIGGTLIQNQKRQLEQEICQAVEKSELGPCYAARGIAASDITNTLMAIARGINVRSSDQTFVTQVSTAINILTAACVPASKS